MTKNTFSELISDYLLDLMNKVRLQNGEESAEYKALYYQYMKSEIDNVIMREKNKKHYDAIVDSNSEGLSYVERLYKRQATIDMTKACSAHCRYCLRQNYSNINFNSDVADEIIFYLKNDIYLKEVLITGGDPLLDCDRLLYLMDRIIEEASNIRIIRIGTRLPVQNPLKLENKIIDYFYTKRQDVTIEIALQINHKIEYQSETDNCIRALQDTGVTVYAQNVLLRNVNDNLDSLIDLYDLLRYKKIEAHYLFHPVPIIGTSKFRMPLDEFINFARIISSSGEIPGRSKPMFSIMTDVGKCTLYHGMLGKKDKEGMFEIYTGYKLKNRLKWNPNYKLPESAYLNERDEIIVKYLDGES